VAFLTAFDQYAVRPFEVHALDYLLKPFDEERVASTMQHLEEQLTGGDGLWQCTHSIGSEAVKGTLPVSIS
jgi:DNA-binding LytR/AlgR family response regulator